MLLTAGDLTRSYQAKPGGYHLAERGGLQLVRTDRAALSLSERLLNQVALFHYRVRQSRIPERLSAEAARDAYRGAGACRTSCGSLTDPAIAFLLGRFGTLGAKVSFAVDAVEKASSYRRDVDLFARGRGTGGIRCDPAPGKLRLLSRADGLRLDFLPIDGHWNEAAQEVAAQAIAPHLSAVCGGGLRAPSPQIDETLPREIRRGAGERSQARNFTAVGLRLALSGAAG